MCNCRSPIRRAGDDVAVLCREPETVEQRTRFVGAGGNTGRQRRSEHEPISPFALGQQRQRRLQHRAVIRAHPELRIDRPVDSQCCKRAQPGNRILLGRQQSQLIADSRTADRFKCAVPHRRACQLERVMFDPEVQAPRVSGQSKQPGGIVCEAPVVKDPQLPLVEIVEGTRNAQQLPTVRSGQRERDRVDREIPPSEILASTGWLNLGQRSGLCIPLTSARAMSNRTPSISRVAVEKRSCARR